jgi:hypothetical protein
LPSPSGLATTLLPAERYDRIRIERHPLRSQFTNAKGDKMLTVGAKLLRTDFAQARSSRSAKRNRFQRLREYVQLDWEPWTDDGPSDSLISDESMSAVAEASRTAYAVMHLTKDQLIKIHGDTGFDGFEETVASLTDSARMLMAVIQMIEGARARMIVSACACLQKQKPQNLAYRHGMVRQGRRKPLR